MDLSCLNESQIKAVTDTEGAVLVFAGAGSGKTRTLTYRVAYLIEKGISPWNILAITFTNKATNEMRQRLEDMLGRIEGLWISTFHSFCAKILRIYADRVGYTQNFSILDDAGSERMVKKVLREKSLDEKKYLAKIRAHISAAKNKAMDADNYFDYLRGQRNPDSVTIAECYERYEQTLKENNAMDFDDLLIKTIDLFQNNQDVLEHYRQRFKYIHVDEFQDTNTSQIEIIKMLSGEENNVFVVGDDDQSIYGWRGANIENILNFEKHFKQIKIHKLTQNYRSTQEILDVANRVIRRNKNRSEKSLFSARGEKGAQTMFNIAFNDHREAEWVVENILNLKYNHNYKNSDIAILVRAGSLTRLFEMKLRDSGIAYKVYGGFRFFDRKEIQDLLAYMRLIVNPLDSEALTRIINFPKRGIGDSTVEALENYCKEKNISLFDGIMDIESNTALSAAVKSRLSGFKEVLSDFIGAKARLPLYDFCLFLVEKLELEKIYFQSDKQEDVDRWYNIQELLSHVKEYSELNPHAGVEELLQTIALESSPDDEDEDDKLVLGTMHSVKGLEFKAVFVAGCEEGIFPSMLAINEGDKALEEERRVMYVAVTRAKERLFISCAQRRFRFNREQDYLPSRFLYEAMGEERQDELKLSKLQRIRENIYRNIDYDNAFSSAPSKQSVLPSKPIIHLPQEKIYNTDTDGFESGVKVRHKRYGIGTILVVEGSGKAKTATIMFKDLGVKKFNLSCAPLELV